MNTEKSSLSTDATDPKNLMWLWPLLGAVGVVLAIMVAFGITIVMIWKRSYGYQIFYYYICQICCLRLGLRSSGFTHD